MSTKPAVLPDMATGRTRTALSWLHEGVLVPEYTFALTAPDPLLRHKPLPALPSESHFSDDSTTTSHSKKPRLPSKASRKRRGSLKHRRSTKASRFHLQLQQPKALPSRPILPPLTLPIPVKLKEQCRLKATLLSLFKRATTVPCPGSAQGTEEVEEMELLRQGYLFPVDPSYFGDKMDDHYGLRPFLFLTPQERETILEKKRLVSQEKVRMVFGEAEAMDNVQGYGFDWLNWMEYRRKERMLDCVKDLKGLDRRNACRAAMRHCIRDEEDDEYDF
ncbi:hypothetical protein VNI00_003673 [Paramarasmius palmivorus]|uniref:Uncharacterized protein n=1 Tax=Paramarasmius palmivorus TaxID=297713 RepID=A0AAW0DS96_9AGAR